jgi:hypothetical protein
MEPSAEERRRARQFGFFVSFSIHSVVAALALWPVELTVKPVRQEPADSAVFFVESLPQTEPPSLPGLNPIDQSQDDLLSRVPGESANLSLPGFNFDFSKVAERAPLLFPFLTPGLSLERFGFAERKNEHLRMPPAFASAAHQGSDAVKPRLERSPEALQALVDKSWSRRDRWSVFQPIETLANTYHPNDGKLPDLLRAYTEQNGLQPYSDPGSRDPRLWTELGLASDHVEFIGFISRYRAEHPTSRAAIELLFLLDKLTLASRDALVTLLDADPEVDLRWTQQSNPKAHAFIVRLQRHYNAVVITKGLNSREALGLHYDSLRLAILNGILQASLDGYRASDAHFLIGSIYWRQGRRAEAVNAWRRIVVNPSDFYATANSEIVTALAVAPTRPASSNEREINRILHADYGRWISASIDRLRKFGYRRLDQY